MVVKLPMMNVSNRKVLLIGILVIEDVVREFSKIGGRGTGGRAVDESVFLLLDLARFAPDASLVHDVVVNPLEELGSECGFGCVQGQVRDLSHGWSVDVAGTRSCQ